jgi:hypothetical protein
LWRRYERAAENVGRPTWPSDLTSDLVLTKLAA